MASYLTHAMDINQSLVPQSGLVCPFLKFVFVTFVIQTRTAGLNNVFKVWRAVAFKVWQDEFAPISPAFVACVLILVHQNVCSCFRYFHCLETMTVVVAVHGSWPLIIRYVEKSIMALTCMVHYFIFLKKVKEENLVWQNYPNVLSETRWHRQNAYLNVTTHGYL